MAVGALPAFNFTVLDITLSGAAFVKGTTPQILVVKYLTESINVLIQNQILRVVGNNELIGS